MRPDSFVAVDLSAGPSSSTLNEKAWSPDSRSAALDVSPRLLDVDQKALNVRQELVGETFIWWELHQADDWAVLADSALPLKLVPEGRLCRPNPPLPHRNAPRFADIEDLSSRRTQVGVQTTAEVPGTVDLIGRQPMNCGPHAGQPFFLFATGRGAQAALRS
jgi:hypothetical protein